MSAEVLRNILHELARTAQAKDQKRFLATVTMFTVKPEASGKKKATVSLKKQVNEMLDLLNQIADGELLLESEINEKWDDWYNRDEDEFLFTDPDDIASKLKDALLLLHTCLIQKAYDEGYQLAEAISVLSVQANGEYDDYSLDLKDLIDKGLLEADMDEIIRDAVLLTCKASPENERAEALLRMLGNFHAYQDFSISSLGGEMDVQAFLPSWIRVLGERKEQYVDPLLLEAQALRRDETADLRDASLYAASHPILYLQILQNNREKGCDAKMLAVGLQALKEIPVKPRTQITMYNYFLFSQSEENIRNQIALLTAEYALAIGDRANAEACWKAAAETIPSVVNYLRLRMLAPNQEVRSIFDSAYQGKNDDSYGAILFFEGAFHTVIEKFMKTDSGIGWSGTFMKQGIALFLLLLDRSPKPSACMKEMLERARSECSFETETYCMGTDLKTNRSDLDLFADVFSAWKQTVHISKEEQDHWINLLDSWIALRVEAIMDNNRYKYYAECATYIAALAAVEESMSLPSAKSKLRQKYRSQYGRRSKFMGELARYGM